MGSQLPPASGIEAFWDLERFLSGAAQAHAGLPEIERESERRGRELVRLALQAHIDARGDGDIGRAIVVCDGDGTLQLSHKRLHSRPVVTLLGVVRVPRSLRSVPPPA